MAQSLCFGLHRLHRHRDIPVRSDEDDGNIDIAFDQPLL
jgi:hypothetical protein